MNSNERTVVENLVKQYGRGISLGELLDIKDNTPVKDVMFELEGVYENAYECTGNSFYIKGAIADIFEDEFYMKPMTGSDGIALADALSEDEVNELAAFFLGERDEYYRSFTKAKASRSIERKEIIEYLKTLRVAENFTYNSTIIEF